MIKAGDQGRGACKQRDGSAGGKSPEFSQWAEKIREACCVFETSLTRGLLKKNLVGERRLMKSTLASRQSEKSARVKLARWGGGVVALGTQLARMGLVGVARWQVTVGRSVGRADVCWWVDGCGGLADWVNPVRRAC